MTYSFESHAHTGTYIGGHNAEDDDGNPAGGYATGNGMSITWQEGPVDREAGDKPNGAMIEDVLEVVKRRLEFYQGLRFACVDNENALGSLDEAIAALNKRRDDREARGVLGQHKL